MFVRIYAVESTFTPENFKSFNDFVNKYGIPKQLETEDCASHQRSGKHFARA